MAAEEWTVEQHLAGRPAQAVELYRRFIALAGACGPFRYRVTKSGITLKGTRRGFAGALPKDGWLGGYLDLQRGLTDPRIQRAEPYTARLFVNHFRVESPADLDEVFAGWLREAYQVGAGAHMASKCPRS